MTTDEIGRLPENMQSKVAVRGEHWVWTGSYSGAYGRTSVVVEEDGLRVSVPDYAHRVAYKTLRGLDPTDTLRRNCDRLGCIHPACWKCVPKKVPA